MLLVSCVFQYCGWRKEISSTAGWLCESSLSAFFLLWPSHVLPLILCLCLSSPTCYLPILPHAQNVRTQLPEPGTLSSVDLSFLTLLHARQIIKACFWVLMGLFYQPRQWFTSTPLLLCGKTAATSGPLLRLQQTDEFIFL